MYTVILSVHIMLAVAITLLVFLQRSEGGALGGLGGQGASSFLTGRQAGNLLTKLTCWFFVGFIATSLTLVVMAKKMAGSEPVSILPSATAEQAEQK